CDSVVRFLARAPPALRWLRATLGSDKQTDQTNRSDERALLDFPGQRRVAGEALAGVEAQVRAVRVGHVADGERLYQVRDAERPVLAEDQLRAGIERHARAGARLGQGHHGQRPVLVELDV